MAAKAADPKVVTSDVVAKTHEGRVDSAGVSIAITAKGADMHSNPLVRRYDMTSTDDKNMFDSSISSIRGMLDRGRRINLNDVMLLYAGYSHVMLSAYGMSACCMNVIKDGIPTLLAENMVMIGVPELTHHTEIKILSSSGGHPNSDKGSKCGCAICDCTDTANQNAHHNDGTPGSLDGDKNVHVIKITRPISNVVAADPLPDAQYSTRAKHPMHDAGAQNQNSNRPGRARRAGAAPSNTGCDSE